MRRHHGPSCFVLRGQTESFQGGDFKLFVIWCPAVVSWGKHLLLQLLKTCLITAHPITVSVCAFCVKCFQLFKSAQILAGPNSWLWVVLVKSQKQGVFHLSACSLSLEWLEFLYYVKFGKTISWNRSVWKWDKKTCSFDVFQHTEFREEDGGSGGCLSWRCHSPAVEKPRTQFRQRRSWDFIVRWRRTPWRKQI